MDFFLTLLDANIPVGSYHIGVLELIGVLIGLAGAILGMKRHLLTWPVGMIANVILFFVYIGATFATDYGKAPLFGQSGRQIFFILTSLYGWWRWNQVRELNKHGADQPAGAKGLQCRQSPGGSARRAPGMNSPSTPAMSHWCTQINTSALGACRSPR